MAKLQKTEGLLARNRSADFALPVCSQLLNYTITTHRVGSEISVSTHFKCANSISNFSVMFRLLIIKQPPEEFSPFS